MITLKNIIREQQGKKFDPKQVANTIFNAKGYFSDDEQAAIDAVLSITSYQQFNSVEYHFVIISDGRTIAEYLESFLEDFNENFKVIFHLYKLLKNDQIALESVIYPYAAQMIYQYSLDIAKIGQKLRKMQGNTTPITRSNYGDAYLWFKPYMGDENFKKWVDIIQNSPIDKYSRTLNPYAEEEQFLYDTSKLVSSDIVLIGQLIVGTLATALSFGAAAPGVIAWIGLGASTSLGMFDAVQEYNLGNEKVAGLMAAIEMIPYVSKIPLVKNSVKQYAKSLATKLATGSKYLISEERLLVKELNKFKLEIKQKLLKMQGNFPDEVKLGGEKYKLQNLYRVPGLKGGGIAQYGKTAAGDIFLGVPNREMKQFENYVSYQRIFKNGVPINELSMKTIMTTAPPGTFKNIMTGISKILPDHVLMEKTSISTDGIMMWKNQLKNGYKPLNETFTVPVNAAGNKVLLGGNTAALRAADDIFGYPTFLTVADAKLAKKQVDKLIAEIPNASVTITIIKTPATPPLVAKAAAATGQPKTLQQLIQMNTRYRLTVTLPKLQSTPKSLLNFNIPLYMIYNPVLKILLSKI